MEKVNDNTDSLLWPAYGQAAIAHSELGILESHGNKDPQPTASTAKAIAMLAVMQKKPFPLGEKGETITITEADVKSYQNYVAKNGPNVPVYNGQKISQYEAMLAVLLASSNNHADTLATWAFGSLEEYQKYATEMIRKWGLTNTTIGNDASGLSPTTTSTVKDLSIIGLKILEQPVLAGIVKQPSANLATGIIQNTNQLLNHDDVIGVKTGTTNEAGGVFILGGTHHTNGVNSSMVVVVMGAEKSLAAQQDSYALFQSAKPLLKHMTVVKKGEQVGYYDTWWQGKVPIITNENIDVFMWANKSPKTQIKGKTLNYDNISDTLVGELTIKSMKQEKIATMKTSKKIEMPTLWQRVMQK